MIISDYDIYGICSQFLVLRQPPSDYIRSLIREDKEKKEAQQQVEALLLEGLESGEPIPVTPEYWKNKRARLQKELKNI